MSLKTGSKFKSHKAKGGIKVEGGLVGLASFDPEGIANPISTDCVTGFDKIYTLYFFSYEVLNISHIRNQNNLNSSMISKEKNLFLSETYRFHILNFHLYSK